MPGSPNGSSGVRPDAGRSAVPGGAPAPHGSAAPGHGSGSEALRWAVFGCALVPVVLVGRGVPLAGAAATALGLGAVTAAARALLRQSGRAAGGRPGRPRGRHGRAGRATRRGGR